MELRMAGVTSGSVTRENVVQREAPSEADASSSALSIDCRMPRMLRYAIGVKASDWISTRL
jgi:hypothetical protein